MAFERCHDPEELQRIVGSAGGVMPAMTAVDDGYGSFNGGSGGMSMGGGGFA
jgi:hypothetical protein